MTMSIEERAAKWAKWPQGDAGDAIDFACDHIMSGSFEAMAFLDRWRDGRADECPEYMRWLNVQRDGTRASLLAKQNESITKQGEGRQSMSWNHRVVKRILDDGGEWFGIHEVFYGEPGLGWTEKAVSVEGESVDELRETLERMIRCLDKPPIIDSDMAHEQVSKL